MAETGVWAPCESPAHAASMAASTSDADLMVTDGDRVVVDKELAAALWTRTSSCITLLRIAGTQDVRVHRAVAILFCARRA